MQPRFLGLFPSLVFPRPGKGPWNEVGKNVKTNAAKDYSKMKELKVVVCCLV